MSAILGINAAFHDPSAALVVDGVTVAAAEEERFSRRKHGKEPVPFSAWELPECAARWCLSQANLVPADVDEIAYAYDPSLAMDCRSDVTERDWEALRTLYVRRAPLFLKTMLPGLEPERVAFVPHHIAHAASAALAAPFHEASVLVLDGRGECASHLAGTVWDGRLRVLAGQRLPHSLGLLYEAATAHLGFRRASDEYKVMALAAYGEPRHLDRLRELVRPTGDGGFTVGTIPWPELAPARHPEADMETAHADLAASVQVRLEEMILELARWLHACTGDRAVTLAGGVALNCVANARLAREGPFEHVWVQPAAGDAGTALGAALFRARRRGETLAPMRTAALGRGWHDEELEAWLRAAAIPFERPACVASAAADILAANGIIGWFQGRSEFGPRALGHRSLLADARHAQNLERLNDVKGREQFRPVAPVVLLDAAPDIFEGAMPSPFMLFTHRVRRAWRSRIPAAVHIDGSARVQTVDPHEEPLLAQLLSAFGHRTGVPVLINTSFNTAGRPMVDDPRDALECFGSSPMDALVMGPFLLRRAGSAAARLGAGA